MYRRVPLSERGTHHSMLVAPATAEIQQLRLHEGTWRFEKSIQDEENDLYNSDNDGSSENIYLEEDYKE